MLIAHDDEAVRLCALDLDPLPEAARAIRGILVLRDDAFETMLAGGFEDIAAIAVNRLRQTDSALLILQKRLEEVAARGQFEAADIVAVEVQQVEGEHDGVAG